MITSQHAEAARIDRKRFMQTKLHRKICNGAVVQFRMRALRPRIGLRKIRIKTRKDAIIDGKIILVLGGLVEPRPSDLTQKSNRVVAEPFPQSIIEAAKDARRFRLPGPPQVVSQFAEPLQTFGQIEKFWKFCAKVIHKAEIIPYVIASGAKQSPSSSWRLLRRKTTASQRHGCILYYNQAMRTVQLFITCLVDTFFPEVGEAMVDVLREAGVDVDFPRDQTCCGQPTFNAGLRAEARQMAEHTIRVFDSRKGDVVLPSGSCAHMIRHNYEELF